MQRQRCELCFLMEPHTLVDQANAFCVHRTLQPMGASAQGSRATFMPIFT